MARRSWWFGWQDKMGASYEEWWDLVFFWGSWRMMWSHESLQSGEGCVKKTCWESRFAAESRPVVIQRSLRIIMAKCSSCKNPDFHAQYKGISISIDFFCIYIYMYTYIDLYSFIRLLVNWSIGSVSRLAANTCADPQPQDNVGWILRRSRRNLSLTVPLGDVVGDCTVSELGDVFFA